MDLVNKTIQSQQFRLDLYYRLSTVVLKIPALRDRPEDIPLLVQEFLHEFSDRYACAAPAIPDSVMEIFLRHCWPGNIRELRSVIERAFILGRGARFQKAWIEDLLAADEGVKAPQAKEVSKGLLTGKPAIDKWARLHETLARCAGNKTAAARALGVTRKTLYDWLRVEKL